MIVVFCSRIIMLHVVALKGSKYDSMKEVRDAFNSSECCSGGRHVQERRLGKLIDPSKTTERSVSSL